jgi:mono/diheme cytochrome c family protein
VIRHRHRHHHQRRHPVLHRAVTTALRSTFHAVVIAVLAAPAVPAGAADAAQGKGPELLQKYCYECHGDGGKKGQIDLEAMLARPQPARREWDKAWKIVRHEFMPPLGADLPSASERQALTDWIAQTMFAVDPQRPDPGRVTIRRLNRVEYEYSVQDLFGHDFAADQTYSSDGAGAVMRLRDRLPPDDTALGFDNVGDFQTVSPALLEKYFDIADFVVSRVIQDTPREPERNLSGDLKVVKAETNRVTTHAVRFENGRAGDYRVELQFTVGGWQEYGGAYDLTVRLNGHPLTNDLIEIGGYKRHRYTNLVTLAPGPQQLEFTTDARKPDFKGNKPHLELRARVTLTGPLGAAHAEYSEVHQRVFFRGAPPSGADERAGYAREIMRRFATRAFRRPVDEETLKGLTELALRGPGFERGVAQGLTAILTSPKFFFRAETQPRPDDPSAIHPLDEHALASRLSYLLWVSLPDDELLQLASEGRLRQELRSQVKRLLADRKSERFFEDFPGQWLRTRNVLMAAITRDAELNHVRGAMKRETEMLFEHIAREDRDLIELLTADYSFMNQALAEYYGLTNVVRGDFQRVALKPEMHRGGILTHGSFLVASSNPNRTSPVKRGLFVLENLLAIEPPPPPPDIPPLDDAKAGGVTPKTVREQLAIHRENKSCASCHAHFDPIGVVLENYDLTGRWRTQENGEPIEAREQSTTGETFNGVGDLRSYFAQRKEKFYRGATEKLLTYALGRGLEPADAVTVDRVTAAVHADGGKFSTLLLGIIESPAFQTRRGDDAGEAASAPASLGSRAQQP